MNERSAQTVNDFGKRCESLAIQIEIVHVVDEELCGARVRSSSGKDERALEVAT